MNNQYLMPANSKKSRLFLGLFTKTDVVICLIGGTLTVLMLLVLKNPTFLELLLASAPLLIAASLMFPVPNYHNVLQLLINIFTFFTGVRKYYWKGWCVKDDTNE